MGDPISVPKLPVDFSTAVGDDTTRLQRSLSAKRNATDNAAGDPALVDTCRQMESLFIHHLLKEMRATIHRSGFITGGRAEEIYTSMMDAEMAAKIAGRGGLGLADMLIHQLSSPASRRPEEDSDPTD
jgi:flagellar protein FlgJ